MNSFAQDAAAPKANPADLKPHAAEMAPLAAKSLLLAITRAGDHFVGVGDRGVILTSADGEKWEQSPSPVHATLTTVTFADPQNGWAAGHDASILHTADGGKTWMLQNFQPELNKPVLALYAADAQQILAIGAYGLFLTSTDGGAHWAQLESPLLDEGPHLNSLIKLNNGELFIAGETGLVAVSANGAQWTRLKLPYEGSLFGALPRGDKGALVFGLRGNALMTDDVHSNRWTKIDTKTVHSFFGGALLEGGDAVLVGADGEILRVTPAGAATRSRSAGDERTLGSGTLSGVMPQDGALLVVGELGAGRIKLADAAPAAAPAAAAEPATSPPTTAAAPAPVPEEQPAPAPSATAAPAPAAAKRKATPKASPANPRDGADITLGRPLPLRARPTEQTPATATLPAGAGAKLKSHVTNTAGTWWYVSSGQGSGWATDAELKAAH